MESNFPRWAIIAGLSILAICGGFFIMAQRKKIANEVKVAKMLNEGKITFTMSDEDKADIIKGLRA